MRKNRNALLVLIVPYLLLIRIELFFLNIDQVRSHDIICWPLLLPSSRGRSGAMKQ